MFPVAPAKPNAFHISSCPISLRDPALSYSQMKFGTCDFKRGFPPLIRMYLKHLMEFFSMQYKRIGIEE